MLICLIIITCAWLGGIIFHTVTIFNIRTEIENLRCENRTITHSYINICHDIVKLKNPSKYKLGEQVEIWFDGKKVRDGVVIGVLYSPPISSHLRVLGHMCYWNYRILSESSGEQKSINDEWESNVRTKQKKTK